VDDAGGVVGGIVDDAAAALVDAVAATLRRAQVAAEEAGVLVGRPQFAEAVAAAIRRIGEGIDVGRVMALGIVVVAVVAADVVIAVLVDARLVGVAVAVLVVAVAADLVGERVDLRRHQRHRRPVG